MVAGMSTDGDVTEKPSEDSWLSPSTDTVQLASTMTSPLRPLFSLLLPFPLLPFIPASSRFPGCGTCTLRRARFGVWSLVTRRCPKETDKKRSDTIERKLAMCRPAPDALHGSHVHFPYHPSHLPCGSSPRTLLRGSVYGVSGRGRLALALAPAPGRRSSYLLPPTPSGDRLFPAGLL
eukprot:scaffold37929_cov37-Tisochrysis_lutea.AAC.3